MRHFYVSLLFAAISFTSLSQTLVADMGVSVSNLSWRFKDPKGQRLYEKPFVGVAVSAGKQYYSNRYFDISGVLGYIQKGGKLDLTRYAYSAGPQLNYLMYTNPVRVKYPLAENIFPFLSVSPNVQYLISYSNHFRGVEKMDELRRFTYGIASGLGVNYANAPFEFGVKAEYYFDFNPVVDFEPFTDNTGVRVTTRTYTLSVICSYNLSL
jgi:hypothetical protein